MLEFSDRKLGRAEVVAAKGRLDATTARIFEVHCDDVLRAGCKSMVLDLRELRFLSSDGLRAILGLSKRVRAGGGQLVFAGIQGPIRDMLDIAGFLDAFSVVDQMEPGIA